MKYKKINDKNTYIQINMIKYTKYAINNDKVINNFIITKKELNA